jgi:hypothetical protein
MPNADYMPGTDAGLEAFTAQLSEKITATPTAFGLTAGIATILATKQVAFADALAASTDPATRGNQTVRLKEIAKRDLISYTRQVVNQIQGTMTVTDAQRGFLGLPVRDQIITPIQPPTETPVVEIDKIVGTMVSVKVRTVGSERRGKPDGVAGINIYTHVGATPPGDINAWKFEGDATRTDFDIAFDPTLAPGTQVWISVCYKNPRFQTGPMSTPVGLNVGGGVSQSA